jgi:hypothetical protein
MFRPGEKTLKSPSYPWFVSDRTSRSLPPRGSFFLASPKPRSSSSIFSPRSTSTTISSPRSSWDLPPPWSLAQEHLVAASPPPSHDHVGSASPSPIDHQVIRCSAKSWLCLDVQLLDRMLPISASTPPSASCCSSSAQLFHFHHPATPSPDLPEAPANTQQKIWQSK